MSKDDQEKQAHTPPESGIELLDAINDYLRQCGLRKVEVLTHARIEADQTYTRGEAAAILGVSTWTVDRARKDGRLVDVDRLGARYVRITGDSMMKYMNKSETASVGVRKM